MTNYELKQELEKKRKKGRGIRIIIETPNMPIPQDWQGFLSDARSRSDLATYLPQNIIKIAPNYKFIITSGGLLAATDVLYNTPDLNLEGIRCIYEEADTKFAVHCQHTKF